MPSRPGRRRQVASIGVWATASRRSRRSGTPAQGKYVGHGPVEAGLPAREPAGQRGPRSRWPRRTSGTPGRRAGTRGSPSTSTSPSWPACCRCSTRACSRTWRRTEAAGGPRRDPAHRDPVGRRARVPELHRRRPRRTCSGSTWRSRHDGSGEPARPRGRRRGRLPQRAPAQRRRGDHRAARRGRADHPAGRPVVHPRRCGQRDHGRDQDTNAAMLETFPYLGLPGGGYQTVPGHDEGVMSHSRTRTRTPVRARSCSTSAATSVPSWSRCRRRWSARRSRC